ncbi:MAG: flagellar basal body rod protein FlgC [Arcobacter sp.]|jgi:flagellar basal-body rod protein FlgC|uniref:flagellar basal body rod protein FlgC n=1 Tax=Arcobacter iocasae TaxID=2906515 RepID=UPI0035D43823|tara:strand:- start:50 stop:508 length:459 start_codon:yes stop_codon:yes gene_type:complete
MGFFDGYNIASSGMSAQRTRINVVSANIANAKTTHSTDGGPYKKQNVVFQEMLLSENEKLKANDSQDKQSTLPSKNLSGVGIKQIVESKDKPVMKFEPDHPDANADGYVAYPNINPVIEMVDLIEAMRSYEANVSAFTTTKTIDTKTLELLR